jgi:Zn-dependent protease
MDESIIGFIFQIAILIMSVVVHEVSHGFMAYALGDQTAKYAGRLTLNPVHHLDPVGSILVPAATIFFGGFIFGWAKPVPYNPYNLSNQKWGPGLVAAAGPLSNIFIALVFGTAIRLSGLFSPEIVTSLTEVAVLVVLINIILAIFNFVPIPPLDGSKVLFALLPYHLRYIEEFLERYGLILLLIFIFFFFNLLSPIIGTLFHLFTGISF